MSSSKGKDALAVSAVGGRVLIEFERPAKQVALTPTEARVLAYHLVMHADNAQKEQKGKPNSIH